MAILKSALLYAEEASKSVLSCGMLVTGGVTHLTLQADVLQITQYGESVHHFIPPLCSIFGWFDLY